MNERLLKITIGMGSCGIASGARQVEDAIRKEIKRIGENVGVKITGCCGMCYSEPIVEMLYPNFKITYGNVTPALARRIVTRHVSPPSISGKVMSWGRNLYSLFTDDTSWIPLEDIKIDITQAEAGDYIRPQTRLVLERCGVMDPVDIDEYIKSGGYAALTKVVTQMTSDEVIGEIKRSGLRGRGGAGFPTGEKWRFVRESEADRKYIICNADEGDPGAFMDRLILESDTYSVLEGMAIAAFAVGASEGYVYVRAEYPLAVRRLREALEQAEKDGWLGENILGTGFNFKIKLFEGAGAFVCGEETAMIASIEGYRGIPRIRPPYPSEKGLWGKPTLVNNVETYACVTWIIGHGANAFCAIGTQESKGTKVFALAGQIRRGGLIEVPMGISISDIVYKIGGGILNGRKFKAVQIGGPAGGSLPESLSNTPIDYEALTQKGAIMGSGGLIVLDDSTCMVDFARFFMPFAQNESCGRCTFCRIGTKRMLEILNRICEGKGKDGDIERLEELCILMRDASFCGLGRAASNPVLTSIKYFRDEYKAHLDGICPAGKCKALIAYIITDNCIGCTLCSQHCPVMAITSRTYEKHKIDPDICIRCGMCKVICPHNAVKAVQKYEKR